MDIKKLYKMQRELDSLIEKNIRLRNGKAIPKLEFLENSIVALQVEISEFANATKCFKDWSIKKAESKERILEELADVLHLALSIGNQKNMEASISDYRIKESSKGLTSMIRSLNNSVDYLGDLILDQNLNKENIMVQVEYNNIFYKMLEIWKKLDISFGEMEEAYIKKNNVNFCRQVENY